MKKIFITLAVLAFTPLFAYAEQPTNNHDGSRGVHVVPLRGNGRAIPEGREARPGQFRRGSQFSEEPNGWVDGDPCWDHVANDDHTQYWVFICD
jgi:hypothetical protein